MYWISVTTLSAFWYCYCRGKKELAPLREETVVAVAPTPAQEEPADDTATDAEVSEEQAVEPEMAAAPEEPAAGAAQDPETAEPDEEAGPHEDDPASRDPLEALAAAGSVADPLERHSVYTKGIDTAYKNRHGDPAMQEAVLTYGKQYVNEFPDLKSAVFEHFGDSPKLVAVFKQLAITLEESKLFDQAVDVCRKAITFELDDGTKSGYEGRIRRIEKSRAAEEA